MFCKIYTISTKCFGHVSIDMRVTILGVSKKEKEKKTY